MKGVLLYVVNVIEMEYAEVRRSGRKVLRREGKGA